MKLGLTKCVSFWELLGANLKIEVVEFCKLEEVTALIFGTRVICGCCLKICVVTLL